MPELSFALNTRNENEARIWYGFEYALSLWQYAKSKDLTAGQRHKNNFLQSIYLACVHIQARFLSKSTHHEGKYQCTNARRV